MVDRDKRLMQIDQSRYLPTNKRGPNCSRNAIIQQLADLLGDPFQKTMGRVRQITEAEITEIYLTASKWIKNPPALAQILIKKKNLEIKQKLCKK